MRSVHYPVVRARKRHSVRGRRPAGDDPDALDEWMERASAYIEEEVATGDFPHLQAIMPEAGMSAFWKRLQEAGFEEDRFDRGLERLLDGIALDLERRAQAE